jgi:hypothetical protein
MWGLVSPNVGLDFAIDNTSKAPGTNRGALLYT